jgi:RNA-binding protein YlmH
MKAQFVLAITAAMALPASAADYAGRWEIAGRQFGMYPSFQPVTDGRLEIKGSGFRELHHKDYLGAVLNLGIERDAIGDLCVTDTHTAVLFCDRVMEKFLAESLTRVANDAVKLTRITLPHGFDGGRKFQQITDTVASPRADSVVAALANLSRERAQALFREKLVEIDYEIAEKTDQQLEAPCVIVIRGKGKFIIRSLCEQTKKGRIRLLADKYL